METSLLNPCISIYLSKQFWKEFRLRLEIFNRFSIFSSVQFSSSDHLIITSLIFIRIQSNQHGSSRFTMMNIWWTMNLMMIMMLMMMMMINGKWWMNDDVMMMTINMSDCCKLRPRLQKKASLRSMKNFIVQPLKKLKGTGGEDVEWSSSSSSSSATLAKVWYYGSWAPLLCRLLHSYLVRLQLVGGCA